VRGRRLHLEAGARFGRVVVLGEAEQRQGMRYVDCQCDCGKRWQARLAQLTQGQTKSCGCLRRERFAEGREKHGHSRTRLYVAWTNMRQRCTNPAHPSYPDYGGRGITVCAEWSEFPAFHAWALASGYRRDLTIERDNVDDGYRPANCRWIPPGEQSNNTRRSRRVTFRGETRTLRDWARHLGLNPDTLYGRLHQGWTVERALTEPLDPRALKGRAAAERTTP
jgi:hypothetical protein